MENKVLGCFIYNECPIFSLGDDYPEIEAELSPYFSDLGITRHRMKIEIWWLYFLIEKGIAKLPEYFIELHGNSAIDNIFEQLDEIDQNDLSKIKEFEKTSETKNKAIELLLVEKLKKIDVESLTKFVHIGCSDEDMDMCAYTLILQEGNLLLIEVVRELARQIDIKAEEYSNVLIYINACQTPYVTTIGKELSVWYERLSSASDLLEENKFELKFNGAAGNYSTFEMLRKDADGQELDVDWRELCKELIEEKLGFCFYDTSTPVSNYDSICKLFNSIRYLNCILAAFEDWLKQSVEYLYTIQDRRGLFYPPSYISTCIKISNEILQEYSKKFMARYYTWKTSNIENLGLAIGYSLKAIKRLLEFVNRININCKKFEPDNATRLSLIVPNIQTVLQLYELSEKSEELNQLVTGGKISHEMLNEFVNSLDISSEDMQVLLALISANCASEQNNTTTDDTLE